MNDLNPAELSAYLDGELSSARTEEIEALIAADTRVRSAFDQLKRADQRLRSVAEAAAFRPEFRWPEPVRWPAESWLALPLVVVLLAWATGKLGPAVTTAILFIACLAPLALREMRIGRPVWCDSRVNLC